MPRPTPPPVAPKPMKPAQTPRCCYNYPPADDRDNECSDKDVIPGMDPLPRMGIGALLAGDWPKLRPAGARGKSGNRLSLPPGSVSPHPVPKLNDSPANSISSFVKHQGGGVLLEQYQESGDENLKQTTANGRSSPRPVLKLGESPSMRLVEENISRGHRMSLPPGYPSTDAGCQGDKNWNSRDVDRKETVAIDKSAPMRSRVSTSPGTKNADTPTSLRYYTISPDRAALLRQIREGISGHALKSSGARKVNGPNKSTPSVLSYPPPPPPSKRGFTAPPPPSTRRFPALPPPIKGDFPPPPPPITGNFPPPPPPITSGFPPPPPPSRGGFPPPAPPSRGGFSPPPPPPGGGFSPSPPPSRGGFSPPPPPSRGGFSPPPPPSRVGFSPPPPSESPQKRPTASSLFVGLDRAALLSQIERSLASPAKHNNLGKVRVPAEPLTNSSLGTSLPSTWDPMPRDENGNDVTIYSAKVPPESYENQEVEKLFQRTANASSMTIVSVERIQNPYLYQVYQMRKQKMDNDNGGNNERRLFHGTHPGTLSKINTQGFNRSFSGLANGTRFGKGVYFARDSSFSKSYASGGAGDRFMYLARVLVGQYCKGDSAMVVPPPKNPSRPEILFDSVVDQKENPSIFVVFFDNQCYPEYLIRFQVPEDI